MQNGVHKMLDVEKILGNKIMGQRSRIRCFRLRIAGTA